MTVLRFPDEFCFGAATSAFQVEGAVREAGRGPSIWDTFCATPGRIANGDSAEVTSDHYHRWREDVALMRAIGLRSYRFSIAWPRVLPAGRGRVNGAGLAFYDRLVDALLEAAIAPAITLYHWDLPQALEDEGGWLERPTAEAFAQFARVCFDALGDRVPVWYTINEPWVVATLGYRLGLHAPGMRDLATAFRVSHHLLLAHGLAVASFRASSASAHGRIGIAPNLMPTVPATDDPADLAAARGSDGYTNRWFLDPVLRGAYPADTRTLVEGLAGPLPEAPGDAALIGAPIDLLGVNYYTRRVVRAGGDGPFPWSVVPATVDVPRTDAGWEIVPDALTGLLIQLREAYGDLPLRITENGAVYLDRPRPDGRVTDVGRQRFLRAHLAAAHAAIAAGVRLEGFDVWSLLDNFEWADGFRPRYGLVDVDYPTGRRVLKDSARDYATVIAAGALDPEDEPWAADAGAGTMHAVAGHARTMAGAPGAG